MITKTARIVKRKGKWCVVGHKKDKSGHYKNFGCYSTKEEAKTRLGQIYAFKHKKAELIDTIIEVADELNDRGMFHIADALSGCIEIVAKETIQNNTIIRIGKIVCLLQKKGEAEIAERIDSLLPEIICLENCECESPEYKNKLTADKAYKIVNDLENKYKVGLIDENSFEFKKIEELKSMLKLGFLFPLPENCTELPKEYKNWWEYFRGK